MIYLLWIYWIEAPQIGLLQQTITLHKIRHDGGQVKLHWFRALSFNVPGRE